MQSQSLERREELRQAVEAILATERDGYLLRTKETASIDFKEEAGRRNGRLLEAGEATNPEAATKLADEVACMSNSPGGGALILGVQDRNGLILGTELDIDWLRQRIYQAIDVAPAIEEHTVAGQRVLALYVAEAREPIADTSGRLRWRVGDSCRPVDRSEWWLHREHTHNHDMLAEASTATEKDVTPGALRLIRGDLQADNTESDAAILTRIGALRPDGRLSQAARLLLTPAGHPLLDLTIMDVPGGSVLNRIEPDSDLSLREQIEAIERSLDPLNTYATLPVESFALSPDRMIPIAAVREAILNGVIHRDWNSRELTEVRWMTLDTTLIVRSPGGFTGGVGPENLLSKRYARYPALADLFRALTLVEKQGVGIDRMYSLMIPLGHRPPMISEEIGPHVTCTLIGGNPVVPIRDLFHLIRPVPRQQDHRVATIVEYLLREPFATTRSIAHALQVEEKEATSALDATVQCTISNTPLIESFGEAWVLSAPARELAAPARRAPGTFRVLPYLSSELRNLARVTSAWCREFERMTSSELAHLSGVSRATALRALTAMVEQGTLEKTGSGRSVAYRLASS